MYFMYVIHPVCTYVVCVVGSIVWHHTAPGYTAVYSTFYKVILGLSIS